MKHPIVSFGILLGTLTSLLAAEPAALRLTLPPDIYAVPGVEMSLYYANVVLSESLQDLSFAVTCAVGESDGTRWTILATDSQSGEHDLTLRVADSAGHVLTEGTTKVHVVPRNPGGSQARALLLVGDSLTHASVYPNELARFLSLPGQPRWSLLGTHRPSGADPQVAHEGYGGWTWKAFNSRFDSAPPAPGKVNRSPFVFLSGSNDKPAPALDIPRYFAERCGGRTPDYVTFLLGINDCFRLRASNPQAMEAGMDDMLKEADKLLAAFHKAAPHAELGVCLTTPPNVRDAAFVANYKDAHPRWNWRQVQHRLVERQIEHFSHREKEGIHLIPTELNLDITGGYPENNAVHPNGRGYRQIAASIYSWLMARMSEPERKQAGAKPAS